MRVTGYKLRPFYKFLSLGAVLFSVWGTQSVAQITTCDQYTMQSILGLEVSGTLVTTEDGRFCRFFKLSGGVPVGVDGQGFFTVADFSIPNCSIGRFDGVRCFLRTAPPGEFIFANGFHAVPVDGACPYNMVFDGVNCFWRRAPFGTQAVSENGNWYITPKGSCILPQFDIKGKPLLDIILGAFDGVVCRVARLSNTPTEHMVLETEQGFFAAARLP